MNAAAQTHGRYQQDPMPFVALMAIAAAAFVSLPALVLGIALAPLARRARISFGILALVGLAWVVMAWGFISLEMHRAHLAGIRAGMFVHARAAFDAAWPHIREWQVQAAPLCFVVALGIVTFRRRTVEELRERDERRAERSRRGRQRRARRKAGVREQPRTETVFTLGQHVEGGHVLPSKRSRVLMPLSRLRRTTVVIGAPGSGKTVTLSRLAYGVASTSNWQIIVIDAKGDPATQQAFTETMRRAGRKTRLFPQEPFDGWYGTGREIAGRLTQLIDWSDEGGGAYYRDIAVNLVRLACTAPGGPPRSSEELLRRFDKDVLATLWAGNIKAAEVARMGVEHVDSCRHRYRSFFDSTGGQLDGDWIWEDAECAYVLLNEIVYADETTKLARFLIEDFKQYLASAARKRPGQQVLLIVDEFSAIADGERMARMVEVVRSFDTSVVFAPQCIEGMGGPEATARIMNAAHTVILHAVPDPEPIIKAAGTKMATEVSLQHEGGISTDVGLDAPAAPVPRRPQRGPSPARRHVRRHRQRRRGDGPDRRPAERWRSTGADRHLRAARADPGGGRRRRRAGATVMPESDDKLLTAADVAELMRVTRAWVYAETRRNALPHLRLGRYVRYRRSAIEAWMRTIERGPAAPGARR